MSMTDPTPATVVGQVERLVVHSCVRAYVTVQLTEDELRALEAIAGYGADPFLEMFYQKLGRSYIQKHENGLRTLFKMVTREAPTVIKRADAARAAFTGDATGGEQE